MKQIVHLDINGDAHVVMVEPHDTLLRVLREELGLLGTKQGCDTGGCGCCTVLVDGQSVYSCMLFAMAVQGKKVTTIEGLKINGKLDELQEAFIQTGAVQCGFCSCGMILAAKAFLSGAKSPSDEEIRAGIAGNLCRCTGYQKIVEAIRMVATRG